MEPKPYLRRFSSNSTAGLSELLKMSEFTTAPDDWLRVARSLNEENQALREALDTALWERAEALSAVAAQAASAHQQLEQGRNTRRPERPIVIGKQEANSALLQQLLRKEKASEDEIQSLTDDLNESRHKHAEQMARRREAESEPPRLEARVAALKEELRLAKADRDRRVRSSQMTESANAAVWSSFGVPPPAPLPEPWEAEWLGLGSGTVRQGGFTKRPGPKEPLNFAVSTPGACS
jgi:chromosome segregation ATPase